MESRQLRQLADTASTEMLEAEKNPGAAKEWETIANCAVRLASAQEKKEKRRAAAAPPVTPPYGTNFDSEADEASGDGDDEEEDPSRMYAPPVSIQDIADRIEEDEAEEREPGTIPIEEMIDNIQEHERKYGGDD